MDDISTYFQDNSKECQVFNKGQFTNYQITGKTGVKYLVTTGGNHGLTSFTVIFFGGGTVEHLIPELGERLHKSGLDGCRINIDSEGDMVLEYEATTRDLEELNEQNELFESSVAFHTSGEFGVLPVNWG